MKFKSIKLFLISALLIPSLAYADMGYTGHNFEISGANGQYCPNGDTEGGKPVYQHGGNYLYFGTDTAFFYWVVGTEVVQYSPTLWKYYGVGDNTSPLTAGFYQIVSGGISDGYFTESNCTVAEQLAIIKNAQNGFASTTGFSVANAVQWSGDKFINLFLGSGLLLLFELRYWIMALAILTGIIYFAYRAFRFFRH